MGKVIFKEVWTNKITEKEIDDFLKVVNEVFPHYSFDYNRFKVKYLENIYGPSLIVMGYDGEKCVSLRPMWRNDVNGNKAFQPCDTAVLPEYRGKGLFKKATLISLEILKDSIIYNFPNSNSLPGYLKMGWKILKKYYLTFSRRDAELPNIPTDYLIWGLKAQKYNNTSHIRKKGNNYELVFGPIHKIFYAVVGYLPKLESYNLMSSKKGIYLYFSDKGFKYPRREIVLVGRNVPSELNIYIYKHDRIFF